MAALKYIKIVLLLIAFVGVSLRMQSQYAGSSSSAGSSHFKRPPESSAPAMRRASLPQIRRPNTQVEHISWADFLGRFLTGEGPVDPEVFTEITRQLEVSPSAGPAYVPTAPRPDRNPGTLDAVLAGSGQNSTFGTLGTR